MNLEKVVEMFLEDPKRIRMGKKKLSKRWFCTEYDITIARKLAKESISKKYKTKFPKILIFDIETSPMRAFVWRRWKQNIYLDQTISEWFMLTWSAKFLFSTDIISMRSTGKEVLAEDDSRIVKGLWKLIDDADIIVAHNGKSFDTPKMNSRFLLNGLPPTSSYHQIDTKVVAAKEFGFSSNKLDALAGYFGFECKLSTDFKLWSRCMDGDDKSLEYMETYNRYDVELLENVYLKLRPWIKSHPNIAMYIEADELICSNCGSNEITLTDKYYYTNTSKFHEYVCECGARTRGRKSVYDKEKRKSLGLSIAR